LILALYSRPHSSECGVNEHRAVIAALAAGDAKRAAALMEEHLEAVAGRALIVARPPKSRELKDILAGYGEESLSASATSGAKRGRR
jgi:hypothetical protein